MTPTRLRKGQESTQPQECVNEGRDGPALCRWLTFNEPRVRPGRGGPRGELLFSWFICSILVSLSLSV